mmetsp:Transcript_1020/g.2260  ORF Transcript_1020/g.2260 Transcript_1020/m.2260 type:complete len:92 (+) Transcript_1020:3930-4205(+)
MVPRHGCIVQRKSLQIVLDFVSNIQAPIAARFAVIGITKTSSMKMLKSTRSMNRSVPADTPRSQNSAGISFSRNDKEISDIKSDTMPPYFK